MGSRGGGSQTTTQQMPAFQQRFLQNTLLPFATNISEQDFTPYGGELTAAVPETSAGVRDIYSQMTQPSAARTQATDLYGNIAQPTEFGMRANVIMEFEYESEEHRLERWDAIEWTPERTAFVSKNHEMVEAAGHTRELLRLH